VYKLYSEGENVRLTDLAERLAIDSPAVTRKVQQLEAAGFVCRSTDPVDARALRIKLTRTGRTAIERLLCARQQWFDQILNRWPSSERRELARLLDLLASSIAEHAEAGHGA
jgi:DNA-binding MarR family transcriptional regulator